MGTPASPGSSATAKDIEADFDRLAAFEGEAWNHSRAYHELLLRALPSPLAAVLEVGCGAGELTGKLALRARRVVALDLSASMLERARARCTGLAVEWRRGDFLAAELAPESFDAVVSVGTLHHLPMQAALARMTELLRPGGKLCVLDVYEERSLVGFARAFLAAPVALALRREHTGRFRASRAERAAWADHARRDHLLSPSAARERVEAVLPSARVRRLFLWRYLIEWTKPA